MMNVPKAKVFLASDYCQKLGGVKTTIENMKHSKLSEMFDVVAGELTLLDVLWGKLDADIMIINQACSWRKLPYLFALWLFKKKAKIAIIEHHYSAGFEKYKVPNRFRFRLMLRLCYGLADRVIAVSERQAEWMQQNNLVRPDKVKVIPPNTRLENFFKIPQKSAESPLNVVAYGRFCEQKGFDVLMEAMKLMPEDKVNLYVAGNGPMQGELHELARELENVTFCGRVDDIPSFLQQSDAVVIPSRWEPFGLVCMEAKAAGKPAIASDIDGLSEQIQECGVLVPVEDPVKLAEAIARLSEDDLLAWGQQGRDSLKQARESFLTQWKTFLCELSDREVVP